MREKPQFLRCAALRTAREPPPPIRLPLQRVDPRRLRDRRRFPKDQVPRERLHALTGRLHRIARVMPGQVDVQLAEEDVLAPPAAQPLLGPGPAQVHPHSTDVHIPQIPAVLRRDLEAGLLRQRIQPLAKFDRRPLVRQYRQRRGRRVLGQVQDQRAQRKRLAHLGRRGNRDGPRLRVGRRAQDLAPPRPVRQIVQPPRRLVLVRHPHVRLTPRVGLDALHRPPGPPHAPPQSLDSWRDHSSGSVVSSVSPSHSRCSSASAPSRNCCTFR